MSPEPSRIFIDTAAWLALANKSDVLHQRATQLNQDLVSGGAHYITTDYILTEVANSLARPPYRKSIIRFLDAIFSSRGITILTITRERFLRAWQLYKNRSDKEWGLTDCTSFIIMEEQRLQEAFTSDRHFQQAGYVCLLKSNLRD
jgi:uncharacterized protein